MDSAIIKLLIVDDDREMCNILRSFFEMQPYIEVCGVAHDGDQAIDMINTYLPDVAVVDIVMPGKDGICVLEELKSSPPVKRPQIVITSASGQELVMRKAVALGADFFVMKPYSLDVLLNRVLMVVDYTSEAKEQNIIDKSIENFIAKSVLMLGVPTQLLGYQYINTALYTLVTKPKPCSISKNVYNLIATEFGTTVDCVERAIRQALHKAFENNTELMRKIMEYGNLDLSKRPSNGRFLTLAAAYIKLEGKF